MIKSSNGLNVHLVSLFVLDVVDGCAGRPVFVACLHSGLQSNFLRPRKEILLVYVNRMPPSDVSIRSPLVMLTYMVLVLLLLLLKRCSPFFFVLLF